MRRAQRAALLPAALLAFSLHGAVADRSPGPVQATAAATPSPTMTVTAEPSPMQTPAPTTTPVVEPEPTEVEPGPPLALPMVAKAYDPRAPGPLLSQAQGYVGELEAPGRAACPPATHVLMDRPPGEINPIALAVLYRASTDPNTNLDFYLGLKVTVTGLESVTPESCRPVSHRLIAVQKVEAVEVPPGGAQSGGAALKGRPGSAGRDAYRGRRRLSAR